MSNRIIECRRHVELEATLRLALEALEKHGDAYLGHSDEYQFAITKVKEALALPEQEPVAWMHPSGGILRRLSTGLERENYTIPLYTTPPQPAQPEQEPFGPSGDKLKDFNEDQWWFKELDSATKDGTPDQLRAFAVVRNLLNTVKAHMVAQPEQETVAWKLVPTEPTDEMLKAMDECSTEGYDERLYAGHAASVYMAAVDVAPTPPKPEQEPITKLFGTLPIYDEHEFRKGFIAGQRDAFNRLEERSEQEPVAWWNKTHKIVSKVRWGDECEPLYLTSLPVTESHKRKPQFKEFIKWAGAQGYDCAQTCNSDTGEWIVLNPMTADLWKAWQAAHGIKE